MLLTHFVMTKQQIKCPAALSVKFRLIYILFCSWNCGDNRGSISLGTEYLKQVENLRTAYKRALAKCQDTHTQTDIEQLQMLCERVLLTMEHWHHRTLQDTRETHSRELQSLNQEKEQALAEETQATLAALDAMRKAHEAEVQREVTRFKQEFVRQQRNEIMDLSERLSVKCLEAAALEEQLSSATRQLAHAQQHILQLEQNPQLSSLQVIFLYFKDIIPEYKKYN